MLDLARRCHGVPVAVRAEEGERKSKWRGECDRAGAGWLQGAAATPGHPRRVACATEGRRRVADTRRQDSASVGHGD